MPASAATKGKAKKSVKKRATLPPETIDPRQEQIDALIREREEIRSKLNFVSAKILANSRDEQWNKCPPSEIPLENLLTMIDEICYYRCAFLQLFQEAVDEKKRPVKTKITQLARDDPELVRKRLSAEQRLTFVTRERDLWKENALTLQLMYASIGKHLAFALSRVTFFLLQSIN